MSLYDDKCKSYYLCKRDNSNFAAPIMKQTLAAQNKDFERKMHIFASSSFNNFYIEKKFWRMDDHVEGHLLRKIDIPRANHCCKIVMGMCQSVEQIITLITRS